MGSSKSLKRKQKVKMAKTFVGVKCSMSREDMEKTHKWFAKKKLTESSNLGHSKCPISDK